MDHAASASGVQVGQARRDQHTFRGNLDSTRHGWLRLTPAYSVRLVGELLEALPGARGPVLDPFCGTGTTLLSCSEHAVDCDTTDINPFLVWLARAKVADYAEAEIGQARSGLAQLAKAARRSRSRGLWTPPLHQIEKWWSPATLGALARAHAELEEFARGASKPAADLLRIAFCRALIERSRAHFGHQSMSFAPGSKKTPLASEPGDTRNVVQSLSSAFERLAEPAGQRLPNTARRALQLDARALHEQLPARHYAAVLTSPPYANRMSYIRELRPYMYWLKYLEQRTDAGVLDWLAIGGTWGSATSNLSSWAPAVAQRFGSDLEQRLAAIAESSPVLSTYVRKYFHDMRAHVASVERVLQRGGSVRYVVGNSKFYDVVVPVQDWLGEEFERTGFSAVEVRALRKRTSKKELYEYLVSAELR
jgi:DNA modification methylase